MDIIAVLRLFLVLILMVSLAWSLYGVFLRIYDEEEVHEIDGKSSNLR